MHTITATALYSGAPRPWVFLAGGITGCPDWQAEISASLADSACCGTLLNPRRANFPMGDPAAAEEQISWEFAALEAADIFSMWFSAAPSDQPICMYELGRALALRRPRDMALGVDPGYRREADVRIQARLALGFDPHISEDLPTHAKQISGCAARWFRQR